MKLFIFLVVKNRRIWEVAFRNPQLKESESCSVEKNIFCYRLVGNILKNVERVILELWMRNLHPPHQEIQTKFLLKRSISEGKYFLNSGFEFQVRLKSLTIPFTKLLLNYLENGIRNFFPLSLSLMLCR